MKLLPYRLVWGIVIASLLYGCSETPTPDAFLPLTETSYPTQTALPSATAAPPSTSTSTPPPIPMEVLPPMLAWDFYPHGITREGLLALLPDAVQKSGHVKHNETWSGTIHVTGDIHVLRGVTLTIEPGTVVLIAARSDDLRGGITTRIDQFNPKDPRFVGAERVEFSVDGSLIVKGTQEQPVIITSDATAPQNDDWGRLGFSRGSSGEITRAIVEFTRVVGIQSSDLVIRQSIIRNMMEAVVIGFIGSETDPETDIGLKPLLTQNYIYNTGRHAITVRSGSPIITHNIIRARPDMDTSGWEQGAVGTDLPTCPIFHHNFLDGGRRRPYNGEIHGQYFEYTKPLGIGLNSLCALSFEYNTITGSRVAVVSHTQPRSLMHNNIIPTAPAGAPLACLWIMDFQPEESDIRQFQILEEIGGKGRVDTISAPHNYWGTTDIGSITNCFSTNIEGLKIEYEPFEKEFIREALPNWHEFEW